MMHISETPSFQTREARLRGTIALGDIIYHVLRCTGIHYVYRKLRPGCGCAARRSRLNSIRFRSPIVRID